MPLPSFTETAKCLDNKRLGKQRVEAYQIFLALTTNKGWVNHPATKMWKGHERALCEYGLDICDEWMKRGYRDTLFNKFLKFNHSLYKKGHSREYPKWMGDTKFHAAHRSNLLRKNPDWYSKYNWKENDNLPYIWPTKELIKN